MSHARYRSVRDPLVLRVRVAGPVRLGQVPFLYPAQRRRPLLLCPLEPLAGPDPSKHRRDLARLNLGPRDCLRLALCLVCRRVGC